MREFREFTIPKEKIEATVHRCSIKKNVLKKKNEKPTRERKHFVRISF